jgi:hypothetical protein
VLGARALLGGLLLWLHSHDPLAVLVGTSPLLTPLSARAQRAVFYGLGLLLLTLGALQLLAVLWPWARPLRRRLALAALFVWLFLAGLWHAHASSLAERLAADTRAGLAFWLYWRLTHAVAVPAWSDHGTPR